MNEHRVIRLLSGLFVVALIFFFSSTSRAQDNSDEAKGVDSGEYNVRQSVEVGYRGSWINGNQDTYDTFVNLGSGARLLDYTLDMRSLNHRGLLFDDLTFSNFGYGGDPDDVTRLRIDKNKWYDFQFIFRRDKNFWDYNLLANPLNPVPFTSSPTTPSFASTQSPHSLDLVRRMQDYGLILLPQSRVRFRLGYSRNVNEGPALTTEDATVEIPMAQNFRMTTNAYRVAVDFRVLPKTTVSYDQSLEWDKYDTSDSLANTPFLVQTSQFPGTVPVNMGINWYYPPTATTVPCAAPLVSTGFANNATTTTGLETANVGCKMVQSYTRTAPTRNFMPTERLSFQSTSVPRLEMSGSGSYTNSTNRAANLYDSINEWTASTTSQVRDSIVSGPANANEIYVHANWSAIYSLTQKVRLLDSITYDHWQNPGSNDQTTTSLFATQPSVTGQTGILLPIAQFVLPGVTSGPTFAGICPSPYAALTCPQHQSYSATTGALSATSTAAADATTTLTNEFVAQKLLSNTIQVQADLTNRISGRIGYRFENRQIGSEFASQTLNDIYYPGGLGGTAANDYFAARGNCPYTAGKTAFNPAAGGTCTQNADGSVTWAATPATISSALTVPRTLFTINEQVALAGLTLRPMDTLRIDSDFEFGYSDQSFTRVWPRQIQSYKVHADYRPRTWATVDGAVDIHENRDNVYQVNNLEHARTYSVSFVVAPTSSKFTYTLGYNFTDLYLQTYICFDDTFGTMTNAGGGTGLPTFATCPITNTTSNNTQGGLESYASKQHYAYSDVPWKPVKRVTIGLGYSGAFVGGRTGVLSSTGMLSSLNPLQPGGTIAFNYTMPFASFQVDLYKGLSYKTTWNYYGYNSKSPMNTRIPIMNGAAAGTYALEPIPATDFNGSNVTFSCRYSF